MQVDEKYPLALPQGTILAGQYVIGRVLGQGGFGITYQAADHKTGQTVAVKEFFPDSMAARTNKTTVSAFSGERGESFAYGKDCFLKEAETLAQFIGNEHIVRVFSYFEENGTAYFVMEFIEGTSFDQYIKDNGGKVSYEDAEKILLPVIDALAAVHAKGIVHRDVTPDNIYITKDGGVKLLDFGAARYSLGDQSRSLDVVLKHGFAPKEQYTRHGKQGPYTDVYTVGASFYFAVTGKRPPDSIDRLEEDDLIPPSSLVRIPREKENAILTALSVQPAKRYQTMGEFRQALMGASAAGARPVQQRVFTAPAAGAQPVQGGEPQSGMPQPMQQGMFTSPQMPYQPSPQPAMQNMQRTPPQPAMQNMQWTPPQSAMQNMQWTPQQPVPMQQKQNGSKKKKWLLPAGIGAGVAAAAIIIAFAVPHGDKDKKEPANYIREENPTVTWDPPEPTPEVPINVSGNITASIKIRGNLSANISNGSYVTVDGGNIACWYPGAGLVWVGNDNVSTYDPTNGVIQSISVVDDVIYYVDADSRACRVGTDGSGIAYLVEGDGYEISKLWIAEGECYFLTTDYKLCYCESGKSPSCSVTIYDGPVFYDDYIYFVPKDDPQGIYRMGKTTLIEGGGAGELVCRIKAGDISLQTENGTFTVKGNGSFCPYAAADGYLYAVYSEKRSGSTDWEAILQINLSDGKLSDTMVNPAIVGGHITSVNESQGYLYFANYNVLTQESSVERCLTSCFQTGTGTIDTVWEENSRYIAAINVFPDESEIAFYRVDPDNNRQIVIKNADGSGEPTIISEADFN